MGAALVAAAFFLVAGFFLAAGIVFRNGCGCEKRGNQSWNWGGEGS